MTLFDNTPVVDHEAMAALAVQAIPRERLCGEFVNLLKSTDLFPFGYSVSHWVRPGVAESEVLEFNPRSVGGVAPDLPRLTASNYEEQVAVHEAVGARIVGRGKLFRA